MAAVVLTTALALAGCKTIQPTDLVSGATGAAASADTDPRRSTKSWGERYRASPKDAEAAIRYAQALRGNDQRSRRSRCLSRLPSRTRGIRACSAPTGVPSPTSVTTSRRLMCSIAPDTPDQPDWRILSVQGAVLDQMGRHEEAQRYYATALRIAPDEPSVLSKSRLVICPVQGSGARKSTLRRAVGQPQVNPRVRQNLALVVGLQGRFTEAEGIARADLPSDEAAANVAYLRQMMAQQNGWSSSTSRWSGPREADRNRRSPRPGPTSTSSPSPGSPPVRE